VESALRRPGVTPLDLTTFMAVSLLFGIVAV
jgi:hypothetical protein